MLDPVRPCSAAQTPIWVRETKPSLSRDVLDVRRDGPLGDHQRLSDLVIAEPLRDQRRHLALSRRQLVRSRSGPWLGRLC